MSLLKIGHQIVIHLVVWPSWSLEEARHCLLESECPHPLDKWIAAWVALVDVPMTSTLPKINHTELTMTATRTQGVQYCTTCQSISSKAAVGVVTTPWIARNVHVRTILQTKLCQRVATKFKQVDYCVRGYTRTETQVKRIQPFHRISDCIDSEISYPFAIPQM